MNTIDSQDIQSIQYSLDQILTQLEKLNNSLSRLMEQQDNSHKEIVRAIEDAAGSLWRNS